MRVISSLRSWTPSRKYQGLVLYCSTVNDSIFDSFIRKKNYKSLLKNKVVSNHANFHSVPTILTPSDFYPQHNSKAVTHSEKKIVPACDYDWLIMHSDTFEEKVLYHHYSNRPLSDYEMTLKVSSAWQSSLLFCGLQKNKVTLSIVLG